MKCQDKKRYPAEKAAYRVLFHRLKETTGLRVYQCHICCGWHLTKQISRLTCPDKKIGRPED